MQRMSDEYFDAKQEVGGIPNTIYEIDDLIRMVMFGDYYFAMFACRGSPEYLRLMSIDPVLVGRDWPGINIKEGYSAIGYQQYAPRANYTGRRLSHVRITPRIEKRPTDNR